MSRLSSDNDHGLFNMLNFDFCYHVCYICLCVNELVCVFKFHIDGNSLQMLGCKAYLFDFSVLISGNLNIISFQVYGEITPIFYFKELVNELFDPKIKMYSVIPTIGIDIAIIILILFLETNKHYIGRLFNMVAKVYVKKWHNV